MAFLGAQPDELARSLMDDPATYAEAISGPDAMHWRGAIASELASIKENGTWEIVAKLPPGRHPIGCKWIFERKFNPNGTIDKFKARLVAKGYAQTYGVDYEETYAPVAKYMSIHILLVIGTILDLEIHQMDVKTAFLNGNLDEEIYMEIPEGVECKANDIACRLVKSLYGLKQSPRQWNYKLNAFLIKLKFRRLEADYSIYLRNENNSLSIIAVYIDDLIILTRMKAEIDRLKSDLSHEFKMTDCGEIGNFLGINVNRDRSNRQIFIDQAHYATQTIAKFGMVDCKPVSTPLEPSAVLRRADEGGDVTSSNRADKT